MKSFLLYGFLLVSGAVAAQTYPFVDDFETYTNFTTLGTQGGYRSDMSVYQTHGIGSSKGLISQISTFNTRDTTVSPLIGPLTATSRLSFYYRIVDQSLYPATATVLGTNDKVEIFAGNQSLGVYQSIYSITQATHTASTAFKKVTIPVGNLAGQSGNLKIVVTKGTATDYFVDIDSLVVMDSSAQAAALSVNGTKTDVSCFGNCNGSISVTATGGTTPYSYSWSNALPATATQSNLCAGTYQVTVTDNAGASITAAYSISEPTAVAATETHTSPLCAGGTTGCIDVSVSGGTNPYTYAWNTTATTQDICNLAAGNFTLTITDARSCSVTVSVSLTNPAALQLSSTLSDVSCFGEATGCINLSVAGGASPYAYSWSNAQTSEDICNVVAGSYTTTVTDANNCTATATYVLSEPAQLVYSTTSTDPTTSTGADGTITLQISGGINPYQVSIDGGVYTQQTSFTSLAPGCYSISVKDAAGCMAETDTVCITAPTGISHIGLSGIQLYPTVANEQLQVSSPTTLLQQVAVYDITGRLFESLQPEANVCNIRTGGMPAGNYLVRIRTQEGWMQQRILVVH